MDLSGKFSRTMLCLAVACAYASAAHAGPAGPVVSAGRASYDAATLTLTSTTAHTQIGWQSFHVGAGEVVNFIQPSAQSSVLNQIFNPQSLNILGSLRSNGSVLFMNSGRVTGAGLNLDLAGMISSSLRLPQLALAQSGSTLPAHPLTSLAEGSVYVISQDEQAVTTLKGDVLLNPGRTVELAHASMPALRVVLTAPAAEAINLSRLVGGKRETGIFAGLFRIPAAVRQAAQPEDGTILTARSGERGPDTAALERFYRYALLYAQMRHETLPHEGGMMRVAAAPGERVMLAAVKSRSSVLPREIEIGAPVLRARAPAAIPSRLPAPAASEQLQEKEQHQQFEQKDQKEETFNQLAMAVELRPVPARAQNASASDIGRALAPLAAEVMANLDAQPISVALDAMSIPDRTALLALASVEPPAEMTAERSPQSTALAFASAEPPAEMAATRSPQPTTLAFASAEPPAEMTAVRSPRPLALAFVAVEPPAEMAATRSLQPTTLTFASAEPPAEMTAVRSPQPLALAFVAVEPPVEMAATRSLQPTTLAYAPAEPPAEAVAAPASRAIRGANGRDAEAAFPRTRQTPRSSPAIIVVALAQHAAAPAPHDDAPAKEVLIERRAPRYFTDFRGAMFFM